MRPGTVPPSATTPIAGPASVLTLPPPAPRSRISSPRATSFRASDEDLLWLYPDLAPEDSLAAWLKLGPAVVALTRGADGPVVMNRQGRVELPGETIDVADTVGAGDSFMAALIAGLSQLDLLGATARPRLAALAPGDLHVLAAYANRAAAITCSRPGADPPGRAELGTASPDADACLRTQPRRTRRAD